jgi:large subunit ribosomal protein L9
MKVILKEDVASLGKRGDTVKVSDGYARNYLIPKGLAMEATGKNINVLEHTKKVIAQQSEKERKKAESLVQQFSGVTVTIPCKVGEMDKLFGSVTGKDIEKALMEKGFEVDKRQIVIEDPIKSLGEHRVKVKLYPGIFADIAVTVTRVE